MDFNRWFFVSGIECVHVNGWLGFGMKGQKVWTDFFLIKTDNNIKNGVIEWVEQSGSRSGDSWNGIPAENLEWNWFGNRRENYFSIKIFSPTFLINNFKFVSLGQNITAAAESDGTELWHWHTNTTHKKISFSKSIFSRSTFALLLFGFTKSPRTFVTLLFPTFHFTSCTRVSTLFFCFFCHCSRVELAFFVHIFTISHSALCFAPQHPPRWSSDIKSVETTGRWRK